MSKSERQTFAIQPETERNEKLEYVHAVLCELREITKVEKLDILTYLIEIAELEARDTLSSEYVPTGPGVITRMKCRTDREAIAMIGERLHSLR